jgi:glycosyltransferase involved in cell wall biosynthesis
LRILHVIDSINAVQGGPSVSVPALAGAQAKLGHQVTIACRDYAYLGPMVRAGGVEIRSVPSSRWTKGQGGWGCSFRRLVEEEARKVDVVHNHGLWLAANYYARRAAKKAGKPLVISTRGMVEDWSLRRAVVRKFVAWHLFERKNLESAALFHATSESEAKSIEDAFQFKFKLKFKKPIVVVAPNGVDIPEHIPNREALEARFAKLRGKKWILFMSRVHPKKGLLELAKAWMQLRGAHQDWELVIAGPEQDKGYAEKVRAELKGEGVWTGELGGEQKWAALGNAGFMVLPSYSENFGIVVAESLAAGRPVITTTGTPWKELKEWGAGWWVEPKKESITQAMGEALRKTDAELDQMGARGRREVEKKFSWKAAAEKVVEAYKELVNRR